MLFDILPNPVFLPNPMILLNIGINFIEIILELIVFLFFTKC